MAEKTLGWDMFPCIIFSFSVMKTFTKTNCQCLACEQKSLNSSYKKTNSLLMKNHNSVDFKSNRANL